MSIKGDSAFVVEVVDALATVFVREDIVRMKSCCIHTGKWGINLKCVAAFGYGMLVCAKPDKVVLCSYYFKLLL